MIALVEAECCALAGHGLRPTALRRRASRPQLKRDPLGGARDNGEHVRAEATATIRFIAAVPQFTVPDVVRTAQYYRDVLGFQIAGYWDGEHVSLTTDPPARLRYRVA